MSLLPRKNIGNSPALHRDYFHSEIHSHQRLSKNLIYTFDMIEHKYLIKITLFGKLLVRTVQKCAQHNNIDRVSRNLRPLKSAFTEKMDEIVRST